MPQTLLRTLNIYDKGSTYTILDSDDKTHLFTIRFNSRSIPHMIVMRASDPKIMVGNAIYHATSKFGVSTASNITLKLPSSGIVSLNKEGGFFSNDKRTIRSAVLGQMHWTSRQVNNPWKAGRLETSFMKLADTSGKTLVQYKDEGHAEFMQEGLDEIVVSGMAMLSEQQTGVKATRSR